MTVLTLWMARLIVDTAVASARLIAFTLQTARNTVTIGTTTMGTILHFWVGTIKLLVPPSLRVVNCKKTWSAVGFVAYAMIISDLIMLRDLVIGWERGFFSTQFSLWRLQRLRSQCLGYQKTKPRRYCDILKYQCEYSTDLKTHLNTENRHQHQWLTPTSLGSPFLNCSCPSPECHVVTSIHNKEIIDSKLCSWRATHDVYLHIFITEQNLVGTNAVVSAVMFSPFENTHESPSCHSTNSTEPLKEIQTINLNQWSVHILFLSTTRLLREWPMATLYQLSNKTTTLTTTTMTTTTTTTLRLSGFCSGLPGWASIKKVKPKPIWIYWSKREWEAVAPAGPYANLHLIPDT